MRKALVVACGAALLAASLRAEDAAPARIQRYFEGWYAVCPGTRVTVAAAADVAIPGFDAYRVERQCELKNRNELSIALWDPAHDEVFVGEVLFNGARRDQPFVPATDLPVIQATLQETYGVPVALAVRSPARGALIPLKVMLRMAEGALPSLSGFVSQDGAAVLLGEFHPLNVPPERWREAALAESPGVRSGKGTFWVTAFIDFQCEKCRVREPQVRRFVAAHGGAVEIRFLPLVKVHDWAFAAAESAAALANVSPALYARYEEAVFPRAGGLSSAAVRELAADVADAAGVREGFDAELTSGRARGRVVSDLELALRLGLNGTPVFFYRGAFLTSDPNGVESYIQARLAAPGKNAAQGPLR